MAMQRARMVSASGAAYSTSFDYLTSRSIFLHGRSGLGFNELVTVDVLGHMIEARVAFIARDPAGVVLTFEAPPEVAEVFQQWGLREQTLVEDSLEPTNDGESELIMSMMARAETVSLDAEAPGSEDSEDPTNRGQRAITMNDSEIHTPPPVYLEGEVAHLPDESTTDESSASTRLRATTHVGDNE